jgi:DNA-binding response OmpR family regulator
VLAIDDNQDVLTLLRRMLESAGMNVDCAATSEEANEVLTRTVPDIVLLDVTLADEDGFAVLAEIRRSSDVPVIMLTGRGSETDRLTGLRSGADDYVVKPFSAAELVARIETVLRRSSPKSVPTTRSFGGLDIDTVSREVRVDGEVVEMTAKEFDLLAFLSASPRTVFTREDLLEHVWGSSTEWQDPATVTEHVRRLRVKIDHGGTDQRWILTVRGVGYRFDPPEASSDPLLHGDLHREAGWRGVDAARGS